MVSPSPLIRLKLDAQAENMGMQRENAASPEVEKANPMSNECVKSLGADGKPRDDNEDREKSASDQIKSPGGTSSEGHSKVRLGMLWEELISKALSSSEAWIIAEDFNTIATWEEKKGGDMSNDGSLRDFNEFMVRAGVSDVGYSGSPFTWTNN
uniref:Uncharacterized protein n=1 Tax=Kalanchoe fedtschenkoi TaxID=63787 RepID=A0A7N0VG35_KALFE